MKNLENVSKTLFDLLTSKDFAVTILDTEGKAVDSADDARIFNFDYNSNGKDYGSVAVLLSPENSVDVFCGDSFGQHMQSDDKSNWYDFLYQLRMFAKRHLFNFSVKDIAKLKYTMKDIASASKEDPLSEGWTGTKRRSETSGPGNTTKLIIIHDKNIDETVDKRYRNIDKLYIENANGERFAVPSKRLAAGRMLARHVAEGGTPYDERGQHIIKVADDLAKLGKFARTSKRRSMPADSQTLVELAVEHYHKLRKEAKALITRRGYHNYFSNWSADERLGGDVEQLKELFTSKTLDPCVEDCLPILAKLKEQGTNMSYSDQYANWANQLTEGTWSVPDTPEKIERLKALLSNELIVGVDAQNATGELYDLIGNDDLFDLLGDIADEDPNADVSGSVKQWMSTSAPSYYAELGLDDGDVDQQDYGYGHDDEGTSRAADKIIGDADVEESTDSDKDDKSVPADGGPGEWPKAKRHYRDDPEWEPESYGDYKHDAAMDEGSEDGYGDHNERFYADPRNRQALVDRMRREKWEREQELEMSEGMDDTMPMAMELYSLMRKAIAGRIDRSAIFDKNTGFLAKLRQSKGDDYVMKVYQAAQKLVNSGDHADMSPDVITAEDSSRTAELGEEVCTSKNENDMQDVDEAAPKVVTPAKLVKQAYENGDLIGCDQISKSPKDGDNVFIFRRGFFYSHGGTSEKFAAKVDSMLTNAGIDHKMLENGEHWAPFRGGAGVKASTHWWCKVQINGATQPTQQENIEGDVVQEDQLNEMSTALDAVMIGGIKFELDQWPDKSRSIASAQLDGMITGAAERVSALWQKIKSIPKSTPAQKIQAAWEQLNDKWHAMRTAEGLGEDVESDKKREERWKAMRAAESIGESEDEDDSFDKGSDAPTPRSDRPHNDPGKHYTGKSKPVNESKQLNDIKTLSGLK